MNPVIGAIFGTVGDLFNGWREDRRQEREANSQIAQAELRRDTARIEGEAQRIEQGEANTHAWEMEAVRQAGRSWKDEYLTILLTIPAIMGFVPGLAPYVEAGFAAMTRAPDWYVWFLGAAVGFAFGVRHFLPQRR